MQTGKISPAACEAMREQVRNGATFREVADDHDVIYDTVQYHVRDDCSHEVAVEPIPY